MFPESSGLFIAQRDLDIFIVKVKGVYPTMQLDKKAINLGGFFRDGKIAEVPQNVLDNIEMFHTEWEFRPLNINFGVFSLNEFNPNGNNLYLSEDEIISIRNKYYRLCQQGVSPLKVARALGYEFKVSTDQILKLINSFDAQANQFG